MADTPSIASGVRLAGSEGDPGGLVARAAAGDRLAFGQLVVRHQDRVTRLAYRLLGWRGEVEDVVQDVFVTVLRSLPGFRGESQFATWLYRITVNECRRARRKRLWRMNFWKKAAAPDERDPVAESEVSEKVRDAVRRLPASWRDVVVLRYLEELPVAEIGRILGLRPNAVEVRLSRARRALQTALGSLLEM
jgi:RNA polymerase sigma-70 factor (ECF subfamily)